MRSAPSTFGGTPASSGTRKRPPLHILGALPRLGRGHWFNLSIQRPSGSDCGSGGRGFRPLGWGACSPPCSPFRSSRRHLRHTGRGTPRSPTSSTSDQVARPTSRRGEYGRWAAERHRVVGEEATDRASVNGGCCEKCSTCRPALRGASWGAKPGCSPFSGSRGQNQAGLRTMRLSGLPEPPSQSGIAREHG